MCCFVTDHDSALNLSSTTQGPTCHRTDTAETEHEAAMYGLHGAPINCISILDPSHYKNVL
jgi:hypothetical protein